jgi:mono/diheme cytochrome c family protein
MRHNLYTFLVKAVFVLPLFAFGLWLVQMLYLPEMKIGQAQAPVETAEDEDIFSRIFHRKDQVPPGHFHMIDEYVSQPGPYQPICLTCHGTYPHSKEKKVRSILNFHNGFLACAACHVRKDPADKTFAFTWVDRQTGMPYAAVEGEYGKYPAKIFPTKRSKLGRQDVIRPVSEKSAQEFLKHKDKYTPDQVAQAKIKLHERLSKKPVFCVECHQKQGYIAFAKMGFRENRVDHLTSSEVANMIEKYETFYLPEVIDFGAE